MNGRWVWCLVLLFFCVLYGFTAQRGVSWQDSGMFQWRILNGDYVGDLGLALAHPLYIFLGELALRIPSAVGIGQLALVSGLGMAIALANIALLVFWLTREYWIAFVVAGMLGVSHMVWWLATITEVYTWVVAGLSLELLLLYRLFERPSGTLFVLLAFVNGLGLAIHNLALLALPVYFACGLFLLRERKLSRLAFLTAFVCYLLGASLYLGLVARTLLSSGDVTGTLYSALFGQNYGDAVLATRLKLEYLRSNLLLFGLNFVNPFWLCTLVGLVVLFKRVRQPWVLAVLALLVLHATFFVRYFVPDQATFALPTLTLLAIVAAYGIAALKERRRLPVSAIRVVGLLSIVFVILFYWASSTWLPASGIAPVRENPLPFRDELRYWLLPWKNGEDSAQRYAEAALGEAIPNGIIIADRTSAYPLILVQQSTPASAGVSIYQRTEQRDMESALAQSGDRPIYSVSGSADYIPAILNGESCDAVKGTVLYRIKFNPDCSPETTSHSE